MAATDERHAHPHFLPLAPHWTDNSELSAAATSFPRGCRPGSQVMKADFLLVSAGTDLEPEIVRYVAADPGHGGHWA
jgi:hypothetical protein